MPKTEYLKLELTDTDAVNFKQWRENMNGVSLSELSNMRILDNFAKETNDKIGNITLILSTVVEGT